MTIYRSYYIKPRLFVLLIIFIMFTGCGEEKNIYNILSKGENSEVFTVEVKKWFNGHKAAYSITWDELWGHQKTQDVVDKAVDEILSRGMRVDFEMNTSTFEKYPDLIAQIRDEVIPRGIHFFGHGHLHVRSDSLTFEEAFHNFFQCYYLMEEWGFNPKVYAYPHSSGYFPSTQLACESAGFIFARGSMFDPDKYFICPDDVKEPENWFFLPSVQIGQLWIYIHNHDEMRPLLEATLEKSAWLIGLYHALGYPDGYCYYPYEDFLKDLDFLEENDFWCSNMDVIACYIKERNNFQMDVKIISSGDNLLSRRINMLHN